MKKILKGLFIICLIIIICGCKKYEAITYTKFTEVFNNKNGYIVNNQTLRYENLFERYIEVVGNNNQFAYYEFKTEEEARKYITDNYKGRRKYHFRNKKNYITVKCTDKMYFRAIQVDKIVIVGNTNIKKNKREINSILKELGY